MKQHQKAQRMQCITGRTLHARACAGIEAHPTDYLQFFAPGNREALLPGETAPKEKAPTNSGLALAQLTRRHMIYVSAVALFASAASWRTAA